MLPARTIPGELPLLLPLLLALLPEEHEALDALLNDGADPFGREVRR